MCKGKINPLNNISAPQKYSILTMWGEEMYFFYKITMELNTG